jgi:hypothetical protein
MNWEPWFCSCCTDAAWMVRRNPIIRDVWWVAANVDHPPFTIAAVTPVCPRCGTTLLSLAEFEDQLKCGVDTEVGSIFDFVRSLS